MADNYRPGILLKQNLQVKLISQHDTILFWQIACTHTHLKSQKVCWPDTQSATKMGRKYPQSGLTYQITVNMVVRHVHSDQQTSGKGTAC